MAGYNRGSPKTASPWGLDSWSTSIIIIKVFELESEPCEVRGFLAHNLSFAVFSRKCQGAWGLRKQGGGGLSSKAALKTKWRLQVELCAALSQDLSLLTVAWSKITATLYHFWPWTSCLWGWEGKKQPLGSTHRQGKEVGALVELTGRLHCSARSKHRLDQHQHM